MWTDKGTIEFGEFVVDPDGADVGYLYVDIKALTVTLKVNDEGLSIEVHKRNAQEDNLVAETWALWSEGHQG